MGHGLAADAARSVEKCSLTLARIGHRAWSMGHGLAAGAARSVKRKA